MNQSNVLVVKRSAWKRLTPGIEFITRTHNQVNIYTYTSKHVRSLVK